LDLLHLRGGKGQRVHAAFRNTACLCMS
jgi:hypothetical protein